MSLSDAIRPDSFPPLSDGLYCLTMTDSALLAQLIMLIIKRDLRYVIPPKLARIEGGVFVGGSVATAGCATYIPMLCSCFSHALIS